MVRLRLVGLLIALLVCVGSAGVLGFATTTRMAASPRSSRHQQQGQQHHTRQDVLVQGLLGLTAGALALGTAPAPSNAWCGKPYPGWAYRLPFNDGNFRLFGDAITGLDPKKKAEVFLRIVGKDKTGVPPILLIPTVSLGHDYLETIEALAYGDRQVILFDPIGVGQSSRDLPAGLAEADLAEQEALQRWSQMMVETVNAIIQFLELEGEPLHIFGHGAGAIPALQYAAERAEAGAVKSLTLASPFVIGGKAVAKAYTAAGQTVPLCVSEAVDGFGKVPALAAAEEARGNGAVFDGRWVSSPAFDKLAGIPTYISYGSKDAIDDKEAQMIAARVPAGTQTLVRRFDGTALPHVDEAEAYADWLDEQLQRAEGKMRAV